nr:ecdysteroid-regulated 16 kDa protein-like [Parasteatoda tepidariorum]
MAYVYYPVMMAMMVSPGANYYKDCGSRTGAIESLTISGCLDSLNVCTLRRGSTADIAIQFKSATDSNTVTASVMGQLYGVEIPFPLDNMDGCQSGVTCPIIIGQSYTYQKSIQIQSYYPPTNVNVKFQLKDDNSNNIVCALITAKVV